MKLLDIPFCCACGKVLGLVSKPTSHDQWTDLHSYIMRTGLALGEIHLVNTYCPDCFHFFEKVSYGNPILTGASQHFSYIPKSSDS